LRKLEIKAASLEYFFSGIIIASVLVNRGGSMKIESKVLAYCFFFLCLGMPSIAIADAEYFVVAGLSFFMGIALFIGFVIFFLVVGRTVSRTFKILLTYIGLSLASLMVFSVIGQIPALDRGAEIAGSILSPILAAIATTLIFGIGKEFIASALRKVPPGPGL
jgi:hypothetical protein